jgi:hypothetical protein
MDGHEDRLRVKRAGSSHATAISPAGAPTTTSGGSGKSQRRLEEHDRTVLLCFDASREGFLWLSRYVCFPFLLVVLFSSLATAWHYVFVPWQVFDDTLLLLFVAGTHMLAAFVLYLLFKASLTSAGHVPLDWVRCHSTTGPIDGSPFYACIPHMCLCTLFLQRNRRASWWRAARTGSPAAATSRR